MSTNCVKCVVQPRTATDMLCDDCRRKIGIRRVLEKYDNCMNILCSSDVQWLMNQLDKQTNELEQLRAELVPVVTYTKDHVPVRVGMRLYKKWPACLQSGCACFRVNMGGFYLDVTAAFSSEQAAMNEGKE